MTTATKLQIQPASPSPVVEEVAAISVQEALALRMKTVRLVVFNARTKHETTYEGWVFEVEPVSMANGCSAPTLVFGTCEIMEDERDKSAHPFLQVALIQSTRMEIRSLEVLD